MTNTRLRLALHMICTGLLAAGTLVAQTVLTVSDGIVRNSLCVGLDCPGGVAFGDSTILMMENNTRIKFGDTSNSPFPNNDWEIEANSSLSGGQSYLGFNDCGSADNDGGCADDLVFAVEAGARASALYVESDGDVGIGTNNPVLDLHIITGNTPAIRLDQDASSGFAQQVWDVAGNEANFFIRDVTNGSALPFRIQPGTASNTLYLANTERVGINTLSPSATLDVVAGTTTSTDDTNIGFLIQDGSTPTFQLSKTSASQNTQWNMTINANGDYLFKEAPDPLATMRLEKATGNVVLPIGRIITQGPTCGGAGCDFVFDPAYELESIEEHASYMWQNSHLAAVGPTKESAPSFDLTEKVGGILNELEKAHIYIERLNQRLKEKEAEVAQLGALMEKKDATLHEILQRVEKLETASR